MTISVGVQTKVVAQMAGIKESDLVYAMRTTGEYLGVKIPTPWPPKPNAKTRNFDYVEAKAFADKVVAIRKGTRSKK